MTSQAMTEPSMAVESQDSQLILDALRAELGVGVPSSQNHLKSSQTLTLSTGSGHDDTKRSFTISAQLPTKPPPPLFRQESLQSSANPNLMSETIRNSSHDETQLPDTLIPTPAIQTTSNGVQAASENASLPPTALSKDTSQQTPTQANTSRDYDKIYEIPSSEHGRTNKNFQASSVEDRTLHEDDTGAVNFGSLIDFPRQSSQVSEDGGFQNARGSWRLPDTQKIPTCDETPFKSAPLPETPALPKNPFARAGPAAAAAAAVGGAPAPFGCTQLFGQTQQQLTSAVKNSPTSSRPSPNCYNPISPRFADTSPLKNRTNVSSPTDIRSSSPQRLHEVPATVIKGPSRMSIITEETPTTSKVSKEDRIPESPTRPRSSQRRPLAHYEPMQLSQARKTSSESIKATSSFDGQGHDAVEQLERRRRIQRKRARAGRELEKITVERPPLLRGRSTQDAKRRRLEKNSPDLGQERRQIRADSDFSAAECAQSPPSYDSSKTTSGEEDELVDEPTDTEDADARHPVVADLADYEIIPETSPAQLTPSDEGNKVGTPASEPDLPLLRRDLSETGSNQPSSLPPWTKTRLKYGRRGRRASRNIVLDSSNPQTDSTRIEPEKAMVSEERVPLSEEPLDTTDEQTPLATRSRAETHDPCTPLQTSDNEVSTAASALSMLSRTPEPSSKTTPATNESLASKSHDAEAEQGLTPNRRLRRRVHERDAAFSALSLTARNLRSSKRLNGEAQSGGQRQTPSENGASTSLVRATYQAIDPVHREEHRLFDGMVFDISVAPDNGKQQIREGLVNRITQAGGTVLEDGFQELFQPWKASAPATSEGVTEDDQDELVLTQRGTKSSFTALIADGHSRKAKYMQALALGLPCLAHQWISACVRRGALVDWQPYLLCAGPSSVLGGAVRSRCLAPYAAGAARLARVVEQRPRLLSGQSVLVVADVGGGGGAARGKGKARRRAEEEEARRLPYVFLCRALGPRMTRVATVAEAKKVLAERAALQRPFNWLYVGKAAETSAEAVLGTTAGAKRGAKRKRRRGGTEGKQGGGEGEGGWFGGVRVLHDELIIQSLILGRIVEVEEEVFV